MNLTRLPPRNTRATYANRPVTNDLVIPMDSPLACASAQVLCRSPRLAVVFQREFSSLVRSTNEYPSLIPSRELASHNEEEKKEREEEEKVTGPGCPPSLSSQRFCERRKVQLAIFRLICLRLRRAEYFSFPRAFAAKGSRPCFHAIGSGFSFAFPFEELAPLGFFRKMLSISKSSLYVYL